jgi:hypothetical protein
MPRPSHSSRFYHPYNSGWGVRLNEFRKLNPWKTLTFNWLACSVLKQCIQNIASRKILQNVELKTAPKPNDKLIGPAFPRIMYIVYYLPRVTVGAAYGLCCLSDILHT